MTSTGFWQTVKMQKVLGRITSQDPGRTTRICQAHQHAHSGMGAGGALPPEHPSLPLPTLQWAGETGHLTVGPVSPWDAPSHPAPFPPTLPDLLAVEQTPSVGRGLAALLADESATWAWLLPSEHSSQSVYLKKEDSIFPNTSLSCYPCSSDCPIWPTIGTSSAPPH